MKLLYCIPHLYNAGGMERVLTQKVNYLVQHGYQVMIVTTEPVPAGKEISYFPLDSKVQVTELNIDFNADFAQPLHKKWRSHIRKQRIYKQRLLQAIERWQPDICISLCGKEIEWLGKVHIPCGKMAEIHFAIDYRSQWLRQFHSGWLWEQIGQMMNRQLVSHIRRLDRLVVLTTADQHAWQQAGIAQAVCIPNPCCLPPTMGTHANKQVLAVGRLFPQKGFDLLIEAWQHVVVNHPDWTLKIVGEGPQREALEKQIAQMRLQEAVEMEGVSSDIQKDYQQCGVFVLSSRYEGLPLCLMEAMSQGAACVAFDCPQGPAELIKNGQTGLLVPPGDINGLAEQISRLIGDAALRSQIGQAACQDAGRQFVLEPIMEQWIRLFEQCR